MPNFCMMSDLATIRRQSLSELDAVGEPSRVFDVVIAPQIACSLQNGKPIWKEGDAGMEVIQAFNIFMCRIYDPTGAEIKPQVGDLFIIDNMGYFVKGLQFWDNYARVFASCGDYQVNAL